jgi:hypothetical protein
MPVKNASTVRLAAVLCALVLAACGGGGKGATTAVGVGIGVSLTSPTATTLVAEGATAEIDAAVSNDPANQGVTWTLTGSGTLQSSTTGKAIYLAPTGVTGSVNATLTATSISDTTKASSVTLTVNGTPVIPAPILFPANQNVLYVTYVNLAGGTAPYTWTVSSGTLPAGLALNGSTSAQVAISGTPTALGSSTFTVTAKDSASPARSASVTLTLVVNAQTACLLGGRYAYLFTGFSSGTPVVRAGSFNVAGDGTVTGVEDYKDAATGRVATQVTSGVCKTLTQNRGTLQLTTSAGDQKYDYAVVSSLSAGQMQENDSSGIVGSAPFVRQDATAFTGAAVAGDHVLGLLGDGPSGSRLAVTGRFTLAAGGALSAGLGDDNEAAPVAGGTLAGTLGAPDVNGRGSGTLTLGSLSMPVAYYVLDANHAYVVSADAGATATRLAGRMQRQTGAGTLDATTFAQPAILSLWGASLTNNGVPVATMAAGRLSGSVASGNSGTINVMLDTTDRSTTLVNTSYTAMPYNVAASGRGTLSIGSASGTRQFVLYADGAGGGFVLEPSSFAGNFGILEPQLGTPFATFPTAYYVGGTLYPGATSPITLTPQLLFQSGTIGGNLSGSYAIDPNTGRIVAAVTRNLFGGTGLVIYAVSTDKLVILGDGVNAINAQLAWVQHF